MVDSADPARRLSLADQALIHLLGFLATETNRDDTWQCFRSCLDEVVPRANRGIPIIEGLAALGERILKPVDGEDLNSALYRAGRAVADYHKARAARAIDALRAADKGAAA